MKRSFFAMATVALLLGACTEAPQTSTPTPASTTTPKAGSPITASGKIRIALLLPLSDAVRPAGRPVTVRLLNGARPPLMGMVPLKPARFSVQAVGDRAVALFDRYFDQRRQSIKFEALTEYEEQFLMIDSKPNV
jgi:hypothetical protein